MHSHGQDAPLTTSSKANSEYKIVDEVSSILGNNMLLEGIIETQNIFINVYSGNITNKTPPWDRARIPEGICGKCDGLGTITISHDEIGSIEPPPYLGQLVVELNKHQDNQPIPIIDEDGRIIKFTPQNVMIQWTRLFGTGGGDYAIPCPVCSKGIRQMVQPVPWCKRNIIARMLHDRFTREAGHDVPIWRISYYHKGEDDISDETGELKPANRVYVRGITKDEALRGLKIHAQSDDLDILEIVIDNKKMKEFHDEFRARRKDMIAQANTIINSSALYKPSGSGIIYKELPKTDGTYVIIHGDDRAVKREQKSRGKSWVKVYETRSGEITTRDDQNAIKVNYRGTIDRSKSTDDTIVMMVDEKQYGIRASDIEKDTDDKPGMKSEKVEQEVTIDIPSNVVHDDDGLPIITDDPDQEWDWVDPDDMTRIGLANKLKSPWQTFIDWFDDAMKMATYNNKKLSVMRLAGYGFPPDSTKRLETPRTDTNPGRFIEVSAVDNIVKIRHGQIGTPAEEIEKPFADAELADKEANRIITDRLRRGYAITQSHELMDAYIKINKVAQMAGYDKNKILEYLETREYDADRSINIINFRPDKPIPELDDDQSLIVTMGPTKQKIQTFGFPVPNPDGTYWVLGRGMFQRVNDRPVKGPGRGSDGKIIVDGSGAPKFPGDKVHISVVKKDIGGPEPICDGRLTDQPYCMSSVEYRRCRYGDDLSTKMIGGLKKYNVSALAKKGGIIHGTAEGADNNEAHQNFLKTHKNIDEILSVNVIMPDKLEKEGGYHREFKKSIVLEINPRLGETKSDTLINFNTLMKTISSKSFRPTLPEAFNIERAEDDTWAVALQMNVAGYTPAAKVNRENNTSDDPYEYMDQCPTCKGMGTINKQNCPKCSGRGTISKEIRYSNILQYGSNDDDEEKSRLDLMFKGKSEMDNMVNTIKDKLLSKYMAAIQGISINSDQARQIANSIAPEDIDNINIHSLPLRHTISMVSRLKGMENAGNALKVRIAKRAFRRFNQTVDNLRGGLSSSTANDPDSQQLLQVKPQIVKLVNDEVNRLVNEYEQHAGRHGTLTNRNHARQIIINGLNLLLNLRRETRYRLFDIKKVMADTDNYKLSMLKDYLGLEEGYINKDGQPVPSAAIEKLRANQKIPFEKLLDIMKYTKTGLVSKNMAKISYSKYTPYFKSSGSMHGYTYIVPAGRTNIPISNPEQIKKNEEWMQAREKRANPSAANDMASFKSMISKAILYDLDADTRKSV